MIFSNKILYTIIKVKWFEFFYTRTNFVARFGRMIYAYFNGNKLSKRDVRMPAYISNARSLQLSPDNRAESILIRIIMINRLYLFDA